MRMCAQHDPKQRGVRGKVYGLTRGKLSNALSKWCKIRRPMADSGIRHAVDIEASVLWCQHATMVASAAPHLNDNSILDNSRLRNCHAIASQCLVTSGETCCGCIEPQSDGKHLTKARSNCFSIDRYMYSL